MALKDIQTNKNELQEYLLLIAKVPEKVNKIDIDIKKELLIDIDERMFSILKTVNSRLIACPNETFEYSASHTFQIFNYYELKNLKDWIESSIKKSNVKIENNDLEAKEPEAININPYPLLFISFEVYKCFLEYTKKHIIEFYSDFSYLKKRLENEKLIHYHKDTDFLNIIYNKMQLIKEYEYKRYFEKYDSKFKSLKSSYSTQRENNFNIVFESLI